jgi:hypothetical protein
VFFGFTAITNKPAFSALFVSIDRKLDHPASSTDFANLVRASPLIFNPDFSQSLKKQGSKTAKMHIAQQFQQFEV